MTPWGEFGGVMGFMGVIFSFIYEVLGHLAYLSSSGLYWAHETYEGEIPSSGQWILGGNLPLLTPKGEDIVAAIMTIVHNGLIAVAQFATLLPMPANPYYTP